MLRAEVRYFLVALQFLTRIPVPVIADFEPRYLDHAAKYFPLVGLVVGTVSAAFYVVAAQVFGGALPAIIAIAVGAVITGALHEDGFADFFDSFGAATAEARLRIMKDSRIGVFGVLALIFLIFIKVEALASLAPPLAVAGLVAAYAGGRFACLVVIASVRYAGDETAAKVAPLTNGVGAWALAFAAIFAAAPLVLLPFAAVLVSVACAAGAVMGVVLLARRHVGGYTGDVLGAAEQTFEAVFLLALVAATR